MTTEPTTYLTPGWEQLRGMLPGHLGLADQLVDGRLPGLSSQATAAAVGLSSSLVAGFVPDLLTALDTANGELARIREDGTEPGLLRWCGWPGCMRSFHAVDGAPGWMQVLRSMLLLCPVHESAGHRPDLEGRSAVTGKCECGVADRVQPGNFHAVIAWWEQHILDLPTWES